MSDRIYNCDLALFSFFFPPETGAGAIRLGEFAFGLAKAGRKVKVLTPLPNFPEGEVYEGFPNSKFHREWKEGADIVRIPILPQRGKSGTRRMLTYQSYNLSAEYASRFVFKAKPRAVFASIPPLPTIVPAMRFADRHNVPFILDVRDLWPEIALALGLMTKGSFIHRYLSGISAKAYKRADAIIVTAPGDGDAIRAKGVDEGKIHIIPNGANCDTFRPDPESREEIRAKLNVNDDLVVVYSGSFGGGMNDLDLILETAFLLRGTEGIRFLLIGDGIRREEIESEAKKRHLGNLIFMPSMPPVELNACLNAADIGFIPRRDIENDTGGNVPVKMFEYMAVGLPLLLSCIPDCEAQRIFECSDAGGHWFEACDAEGCARWIYEATEKRSQLRDAASSGRQFVLENYCRSAGVEKLNDILGSLLEKGRAGA